MRISSSRTSQSKSLLAADAHFWYQSEMPSDDNYPKNDPTWNPPNPDPDPKAEGSSLQERLEVETDAVLEQADRGWSLVVVAPQWWKLSDGVERLAGALLFVSIVAAGASQFFWARSSELGVVLLTVIAASAATIGALWALQVLLQRRVYGRRRSRSERRRAAREKVLKRWQGSSSKGSSAT